MRAALPAIARQLSDAGCYRWRREEFDIRAEAGRPGAGAARPRRAAQFRRAGGGRARERPGPPARRPACVGRAPGRRTSCWIPAKLDHIVAGGVPAGLTPAETLVKEAEEEAAIPASLARQAVPVATHQLRDGAARGAASRPAALLRPGTAGGFLPARRRWRGGGVRAVADRARGADGARHGRRSSSTSTWC